MSSEKRFKRWLLRYSAEPTAYNKKQVEKQKRKVLIEFFRKMKFDSPDDYREDNLIYGDLEIPLTRVLLNLETGESSDSFLKYIDELVEKENIQRPNFTYLEKQRAKKKEKDSSKSDGFLFPVSPFMISSGHLNFDNLKI